MRLPGEEGETSKRKRLMVGVAVAIVATVYF